MERKTDPVTGCHCDFAHHMTGDGCDLCNPEYAEELRKEAELEGAREDARVNEDGRDEPLSDDIGETDYDGDGI